MTATPRVKRPWREMLSTAIRSWSHANLPFEVLLEPLLICMVASLKVTNTSSQRAEFLELIAEDPSLADAAALGERVVTEGPDGWITIVWPDVDAG